MANIDDLYNSSFGQMGSVFTDTANAAITPPKNRVFVAITFLADTQLETFGTNAGGLTGDTSNDGVEFLGTDIAAHDLTVGSETAVSGGGGKIVDGSNTFPKGVTIFGRWTKAMIKAGGAGSFIAYIGV